MNPNDYFLNYSLKRSRKIQMIYLADGKAVRKTVLVLETESERIRIRTGKKESWIQMDEILGTSYARGDTGDLEKED